MILKLRVATDTYAARDIQDHGTDADVVILQAWFADLARALKDQGVITLMYRNFGGMHIGPQSPSGVTLKDTTPETWFLHDIRTGQRIRYTDYTSLWAANVGLLAYQKKFASNVIALAQTTPGAWSGIHMDDVNCRIAHGISNESVAEYPSAQLYFEAVGRAMAYIGPKIRAAGLLAMPNIGDWKTNPGATDWVLKYLSGGMDEQFAKWGNTVRSPEGEVYGSQLTNSLSAARQLHDAGKLHLAVSHGYKDDREAAIRCFGCAALNDDTTAWGLHPDYTQEPLFRPS